jgi:hypothetical protein
MVDDRGDADEIRNSCLLVLLISLLLWAVFAALIWRFVTAMG